MSSNVAPPVGFKAVEGICPLPEKVVNKKRNEMWLVRAPKDFPETEVGSIQVNLKNGNFVSEMTVGGKKYVVKEGDSEALCQLFFFYKDEKKGVLPGKPFVRELVIEEAPETDSFYAKEDGAGKDLPPVAQLTGLKLRYYPPGAQVDEDGAEVKRKIKKEKSDENQTSPEKKEKKQKKGKRETKGKSKPYCCLLIHIVSVIMDKEPKKAVAINTIKNKQTRMRLWQQIKHKRKLDKKERRVKKAKARDELGEEAVPKEKPKMQEDNREYDDTIVTQQDDEVYADEKDDEFEPYFSHKITPKIMITTRERPCKEAYLFVSELMGMIPNAYYYERKKHSLISMCKQAGEKEFTHLIVVGEHDKKVNSLIISHLRKGPTAMFKVMSFVPHEDIAGVGEVTSHNPELILNNFTTRLGRRFGRFFGSMYPSQPQFDGRRVVTFHNQRDYIFVRQHRYLFENQKKARLQELGPRFTLKPRWLQVGTFNNVNGEYEWKFNHKQIETGRRKWFL